MRGRLPAVLLSALLAVGAAAPSAAMTGNTGGSAAQFLRLGAGARALSMGEAYAAAAAGPDSVYWNPAALAWLRRPEVSYSHAELLRFFRYDHLSYAHPVAALGGTVGGSATVFYQDKLDLVDSANQNIGSFSPHSEAFSLAYARSVEAGAGYVAQDRVLFQQHWLDGEGVRSFARPVDHWSGNLAYGIALKYVGETLYDRRAQTFAVDGGLSYYPAEWPELRMAAAFRNAGGKLRFIRERESLPAEVAFGAAYDAQWGDRRFLPAVEISLPYYGYPSGKVGGEYSFRTWSESSLALRVGFKSLSVPDLGALSGLTGGVGLSHRRWSLDLGFEPMAELGQVLRMTAGARF